MCSSRKEAAGHRGVPLLSQGSTVLWGLPGRTGGRLRADGLLALRCATVHGLGNAVRGWGGCLAEVGVELQDYGGFVGRVSPGW